MPKVALSNSVNLDLIGGMLQEAEQLVGQKLHPQTIIAGWRKATDVARAALEKSSLNHG